MPSIFDGIFCLLAIYIKEKQLGDDMQKVILTDNMVRDFIQKERFSPTGQLRRILLCFLLATAGGFFIPHVGDMIVGVAGSFSVVIALAWLLAFVDESHMDNSTVDFSKISLSYIFVDNVKMYKLPLKIKTEDGFCVKWKKVPCAYRKIGINWKRRKILIYRIPDDVYDYYKDRQGPFKMVVLSIKRSIITTEYFAFHSQYFENQSSVLFPEYERFKTL